MALVSLTIRAIDAASAGIKRIGAAVGNLNSRLAAGGKLANAFKVGMVGAGVAVTAALGGAVREAMAFEESMAGVVKVVGQANIDAVGLDTALIKLTRTLPNTSSELATIAASGATLGIAAEDLAGFTELAAKMGIAFDMTADQSGEAMAKLSNVFSIPISEMGSLSDAVNHLSDNTSAHASDIVEALTRVGGVGRTFGLTAVETAALTDSFLALGTAPEIASTAIAAILPRLQNATLQTDAFKSGLERIGLSAQDMERNIQMGPMDALQDFLARLQQLSADERSKALGQMFMQGADARLLATLANDATVLSKALSLVGDEANYAGSMQHEFEARASTTLSKFKLLRNAMNEVLQAIGGPLLAPIAAALDRITPVFHSIADFLYANPIDMLPQKLGIDTSTLEGVLDGAVKVMGMAIARVQPALADAMFRLGNAVPGIFATLGKAIPSIMSRLGTAIAQMLNNADWGAIGQGVTGFLKASSTAFVGVFNSLVQTTRNVTRNVNWHAIGVQAGVVAGQLVGLAAEALTKIDWGAVIMSLQSASVAVARMLAGAIGGFAIGVIPGLGRAALNVLNATGTTIATAIHEGVTGMINLVVDGVRSFINTVKETVLGAIAILRNPGQLLRNVGNFAINAVAPVQPVAMRSPVISAPAAPAPASNPFAPLANTVGSRADGQLGNLLNAAMLETRRKPPGADLVVANTSETIIPAQSAIAIPAPVLPVQSVANPAPAARPMANITLNINGAGQNAKAIAREAVALIQQQFESEVQARLA